MTDRHRRALLTLLAALPALGLAPAAQAQAWPDKAVRIVVPYGPGGLGDVLARSIGRKMGDAFGQPVVIENKPGAAGMLGAGTVAKAPPDGYTVLLGYTSEMTVAPQMAKNPAYDTVRDFEPVALGGVSPLLLVAHPSAPGDTLADFIKAARAAPDKFSFASAGAGSPAQFAGEQLKKSAGISLLHVPYKGGAPAVQDLVAGQVLVGVIGSTPLIPHHNAGRIKILAFTSKDRFPALPDIPTLHESGFKGFDTGQWLGIVGPRGLPPEVVERLNADSRKALAMADVKERLMKAGLITVGGSAKAFETMMREDIGRWTTMTREMGIQPQ